MKRGLKLLAPLAVALMCATPAAMAADGSDAGFNRMVGETVGQDTGSGWFNYYVATVNQQIAYQETIEAYGAAGPNGPLQGFDGYLGSFAKPDTGSMWFNDYVDDLGMDMKDKGY
jgi:hypothetical protein